MNSSLRKSSSYNQILEKLVLPIGDLAFGTSFIRELKNWRRISSLNKDELNKLSLGKLGRILDFASSKIPFYRLLSKGDLSDPLSWLKDFPVVDKTDYNRDINRFLSLPREKLIPHYSSGSSGIQGVVYMNKQEQSISQAVQTMFWEWSGYYPGKPIVQTGMTPDRGTAKSLKDLFFNTKYYNAFGLDQDALRSILLKQANLNNFHLGGYASSLYLLATTALENNIAKVKFDAALSWGDKMFPQYRQKISKAFGCRVFDTYGTTEGTMIAAQKDLDYYYIITPHVYLEILDDDNNEVPDGNIGRVVVTRLDGYSMPLIRYANGDLAIKLPQNKYPEKRDLAFPLLEMIVGRDTDIVYTSSGKYLIVHFFTGIFEFYPEIKQFKVIQRELSKIEIDYIAGKGFRPDVLTKIEDSITHKLGERLPIDWKEVQSIKPTASGKPQIIESFVAGRGKALK